MGANRESWTDSGQSAALKIRPTVLSLHSKRAVAIARELERCLAQWFDFHVEGISSALPAEEPSVFQRVWFVDSEVKGWEESLKWIDRRGSAVFLIARETDIVPSALAEGIVDDVLVYPFRALEVLSKLRLFQKIVEWRESFKVLEGYRELIVGLRATLGEVEALQKSKLPTRFDQIKGFKIFSRYLIGNRPGGNYIDLGESRDRNEVALVLTDASAYRLSSLLVESLPRLVGGLSLEEVRNCVTSARKVRDGVLHALQDRDQISLFYGHFSRKTLRFRYVNLGESRAFYAPPGQIYSELPSHGGPLVRAIGVRAEKEGELQMDGGGRLVLISQGFLKSVGGSEKVAELLNQFRDRDPRDTMNEFAFKVKSKIPQGEDFPVEDCTVALFEVDARLYKLT